MSNFKGSEWNKWDLHVHTPASVLRNEYRDDWDKYIIDLFTIIKLKKIKLSHSRFTILIIRCCFYNFSHFIFM